MAAPTPNEVSTASNNSPVTSRVVTKPANVADGDLLVAQIGWPANPGTITDPTGWTLIRQDGVSGTAFSRLMRKAASGEPADYTWSWTNSLKVAAGIARITGHDATTPVEADNGDTDTTDDAEATAPAVTSGGADRLLLFFAAAARTTQGDMGTWTPPSGMTELWDVPTTAQDIDVGIELAHQTVGSGSTGTRQATLSITQQGDAGALVLIQPAAPVVEEMKILQAIYRGEEAV